MAIFRYKALTDTGKRITGVIDADSLSLAKEKLRREKMLITKLSSSEKKNEVVLGSSLLLAFTRELGQLLSAGLPLYESLLTIEEKYRKHRTHSLFLDLCDRLKSGNQLSAVLKHYPKTFDAIYISMVHAGEKTGSLPWVFEQLKDLIEKRQKLKKQLISAMAYPLFLGCFCFLVLIGLLLFVIPSMSELFEGRTLHPLTRSVLSLSQFIQSYFLYIASSIALLTSFSIYFFKRPESKEMVMRLITNIPIIKTVTQQAALIRFCRSCSVLIYGGITLISALEISRKIMRHPLLEKAIEKAGKQINEGKSLSEELKKSPYIPPLVTRMLAIAEETGKMPEMLHSLSDIYDEDLERNLAQVTAYLQPTLLLILGGVVGLVILSILLPLTDVSSLI